MGIVAILPWLCDLDHLKMLSFPHSKEAPRNLASIGLVVIEEKKLKNTESRDLDQGQWMISTFDIHKGSCTNLADCIYQLWYHKTKIISEKIHCFTIFPYKSIRDQFWPCHKIGHGQPRVISWTNSVVLKYLMLYTNIQRHRPSGSWENFFAHSSRRLIGELIV